jgi:hypothetical protein
LLTDLKLRCTCSMQSHVHVRLWFRCRLLRILLAYGRAVEACVREWSIAVGFKEYLASRRASFTAQGDFVRFIQSDPDFPEPESWEQLEEYLKKSPDPKARQHCTAAEAVWNSFQAKLGARDHTPK